MMKACDQLHPDSYGCQSTVSRIKRSSDYIYILLGEYITERCESRGCRHKTFLIS